MTALIPLFFVVIYLAIFFGIIYLISRWVNKIIYLKQEQNEILRELVRKMDSN